jgi:hypothetical protein
MNPRNCKSQGDEDSEMIDDDLEKHYSLGVGMFVKLCHFIVVTWKLYLKIVHCSVKHSEVLSTETGEGIDN